MAMNMDFMDFKALKAHYFGNWRNVLYHFGIELPPSNRHSACPICRDGKDRFRFEDKGNGKWFCQYHNPPCGDGMDLLGLVKGWDNREVMKRLNELAGNHQQLPNATMAAPVEIPPELTPEERRAEFERHYGQIRQFVTRGPCEYLIWKGYPQHQVWKLTRNIVMELHDGKKMWFKSGGTLLKLMDFAGRMVGLQCIYESPEGFVKRIVAGSEKKGAFHPLTDILPGRPWIICEGFATAYALREFIPEANILMAVDAGNLVHVAQALIANYPEELITIAADNDQKRQGLFGALKVREVIPGTRISMPKDVDTDWDDCYRLKGGAGARQEFISQLAALKLARLPRQTA